MVLTKLACPACGAREGVHLVWGLPSPDRMASFSGGQVIFASSQWPDDELAALGQVQDTECAACGHQWVSGAWGEDVRAR